MDSSVAIGAGLYLLGVLCVVILVRWSANDRRKGAEAAEAALAAGEEPPEQPPGFWDRLGAQERPF